MDFKTKYAKAVKKYGRKEVDLGIMLEGEHVKDRATRLKITLDHLREFPNYNTQLVKFEARLKKKGHI